MTFYDILLEALKRSGACGADLLKKIDTGISYDKISKSQEFFILSIIPFCIGILIVVGFFLERLGGTASEISQSVALLAVFLGGGNRFIRGIKDILFEKKITIDVFVSVSLIATMLIGEFLSAAIVVFIMSVAGAMEGYTMDKSSRTIRSLFAIAPKMAHLIEDNMELDVGIEEIVIGDHILVKPGERIPVDGEIKEGSSDINESVITGEAMPIHKIIGDKVYAGTLNETGSITIEVTAETEETIFSQIVQMVNVAQNKKAPIQKIVDRFTAWYLPIMLIAAAVGYWITKDVHSAVSILLVAAPCALAIGTPTAMSAAMANMTKKGVLIKGGESFELGGKLNVLLLDKTGTVTTGVPSVSKIWVVEAESEQQVIALAACAEQYSAHPFAKAVQMEAKKDNITLKKVEHPISITGIGVKAILDGKEVYVGKVEWILSQIGESQKAYAETDTSSIAVAFDGRLMGFICFDDTLRFGIKEAISSLHTLLKPENIILLSGDRELAVQKVAKSCGLVNVFGNLMPSEKEKIVHMFQEQGNVVAMLGDGINDGPALASADVGIAMGATGTEFASETADIVLMQEDLRLVSEFISLSRTVVSRIKLNIFFAIIFNFVGIILGGMGLLTPVLAIILQEAGTMTVLISSAMLLKYKPKI